MTQTEKDKIEKKVGIAIGKLMDVADICPDVASEVQHIIDDINSMESDALSN